MTTTAETHNDPYALFIYAMKSPLTREIYVPKIARFFTFIGLTPPLEDQSREFVNRCIAAQGWAETWIMRFLQSMKVQIDRKEIVSTTLWNYVAPIKLFCEMNRITVPWKILTRGLPKAKKYARDRAPTHDEIVQLCKYPDRRIKPIVYPMISGGIRLGAWDYLKWGNIQYIEGKDVARMRVYTEEDEEYFTYISGEAYKELKDWMDFRAMSGEQITKDSWLMCTLWNVRNRSPGRVAKKLKVSAVKSLIHDAMKAQGLRTELPTGKRRYEFQALHGFRKFFKTQAQKVMIYENVEKLMGHRVDYSTNSYYKPTEKDLLEDYLKAVPDLTIYKPAATEEQLKARMDSKDQELQQLKEQMNKMQQGAESKELRLTDIVNERLKESKDRMDKMASEIQFYRNEFMAYVKQYGHRRLTDEERKNVDPMFWGIEVKHTINDDD
jgi:integrase